MFTSSSRAHDRALLDFLSLHPEPGPDPVRGIDALEFGRGLAAGTLRRDWTWLAFVDDRPVARGVWWGPVGAVHPVELRCLAVDPSLPHPEVWGAALIRSAHRQFAEAGAILAPDFVVEFDGAHRDEPALQRALAWRGLAAEDAGLTVRTVDGSGDRVTYSTRPLRAAKVMVSAGSR
ncbi:hypothetical protein [Herbiconiux ginsengi]|uniref:N-acetyltransferase domain-containing protein n=1 Tax=Herbiconiux ginsengi TaxID=381665 RepID=A0A1H3TKU0_9MICO|nr:hypothetical protein [Herbiconiux ginsengi]SDZ50912.1 hypothetical protein SAMN05216554_4315 [Herbiconiux ginsengi]